MQDRSQNVVSERKARAEFSRKLSQITSIQDQVQSPITTLKAACDRSSLIALEFCQSLERNDRQGVEEEKNKQHSARDSIFLQVTEQSELSPPRDEQPPLEG